jgi:Polyketide cyclase / dehydrase and lipid transport
MTRHRIEAEAVIDAPPAVAYAIIADYRDGHPHILPRPPFVSLDVEGGGIGAGTVIRFRIRVLGSTRTMRASITEPEPGRVLVESDEAGEVVTTFTVDPVEVNKTRVTITTDMKAHDGFLGRVERSIITRVLGPVYEREIELLGTVASERAAEETRDSRRTS